MKTKLSKIWTTPSPIVAAGSNAGNATLLYATLEQALFVVSAADGTKGVILPSVTTQYGGRAFLVFNAGSSTLKIYPPTGSSINAAGTDAIVTLAANSLAWFSNVSATQWGAIGVT